MTTDTFHKQQIIETTDYLTRDKEAPQIGVHVMGQYVYCKRAGQLAALMKEDDTGTDFVAAPALGGIPTHEVDLLEAALEESVNELQKIGMLFFGVLTIIAIVATQRRILALAMLCAAVLGTFIRGNFSWWNGWWWDEVHRYRVYKKRLRLARRAANREPNWQLNTQQAVNWWELIKSGFDSRKRTQSLYNPDINLKGKPWRILHRGDWHIPVIRIRIHDQEPGSVTQVRLRDQHRARIAAYAYLIETCERGRADWAIVLFNQSDEGLAVPIGEYEWRAFREGLVEARSEFRKLREDMRYRPPAPDGRRACARCPLG